MRFSPGCNCCKPPDTCIFFSDNFDSAGSSTNWTVDAGTWRFDNAGSGLLDTTTANGRITSNTPEPGGNASQVIDVQTRSATVGNQARVLIGWVDNQNYAYVQLTFAAVGQCGEMEIHEVIGGADNQIGPTRQLNGFVINQWHAVRVCYREGAGPILPKLTVITGGVRYSQEIIAAGATGGLGSGAVSGTVEYDNWTQTQYFNFDACPDCEAPEDCVIHGDDFQRADNDNIGCTWVEVAGNPDINNNTLRFRAANELAVGIPEQTDDNMLVYSLAEQVTFASVGDTFRIVLGYLDPDNYLFVEVERVADQGGAFYELGLWSRVGGVDTLLPAAKASGLVGATLLDVEACYGDGILTARIVIGATTFVIDAEAAPIPLGDRAGLGTAALASPQMTVNKFSYQYAGSIDHPGCPTCTGPCTPCLGGVAPLAVTIDLTAMDTAGACATCGPLAAVFVLDYIGESLGDCFWGVDIPGIIAINLVYTAAGAMTITCQPAAGVCGAIQQNYFTSGAPNDCQNWDFDINKQILGPTNACFPEPVRIKSANAA